MSRKYLLGVMAGALFILADAAAAQPALGAPARSAPAFGTYAGAISVQGDGFIAYEPTAAAVVLPDGSVVGLPAVAVNGSGMISFTLTPYNEWPAGQASLVVAGSVSRHRYTASFQLSRDAAQNIVVGSSAGASAPSFIVRASGFGPNEFAVAAAVLADGTSVGLPGQRATGSGYLEFPLAAYSEWPEGSVTVVVAGTRSQHRHLAAFQLVREAADSAPAWHGIYFGTIDFSGDPVLVRDESVLNFNWGMSGPTPEVPVENFSARWTTTRTVPSDGYYNVIATADDGVRVFVDDQLIVEGWYDHAVTSYTAPVFLTAGQHRVRVDYYQHLALAVIAVTIARQ